MTVWYSLLLSFLIAIPNCRYRSHDCVTFIVIVIPNCRYRSYDSVIFIVIIIPYSLSQCDIHHHHSLLLVYRVILLNFFNRSQGSLASLDVLHNDSPLHCRIHYSRPQAKHKHHRSCEDSAFVGLTAFTRRYGWLQHPSVGFRCYQSGIRWRRARPKSTARILFHIIKKQTIMILEM